MNMQVTLLSSEAFSSVQNAANIARSAAGGAYSTPKPLIAGLKPNWGHTSEGRERRGGRGKLPFPSFPSGYATAPRLLCPDPDRINQSIVICHEQFDCFPAIVARCNYGRNLHGRAYDRPVCCCCCCTLQHQYINHFQVPTKWERSLLVLQLPCCRRM